MKIFRSSDSYPDDDQYQTGPRGGVASVHDLIPVQYLFDNMLVMKDGSYRMILKVGAVNLDLKSEREQQVLLHTFGEALNTLQVDFPLQLLLHSAHMDTEQYVRAYRQRLSDPTLTAEMHAVISEHIEYFETQARDNFLLDRSYYAVIPYYDRTASPTGDQGVAADMPGGNLLSRIMDTSVKEKQRSVSRKDMEKARSQLLGRCQLFAGQLSRLNITAELLDELAVMRLLREMYNPGASERQKLRDIGAHGSIISTGRRDEAVRRRSQRSVAPDQPPMPWQNDRRTS